MFHRDLHQYNRCGFCKYSGHATTDTFFIRKRVNQNWNNDLIVENPNTWSGGENSSSSDCEYTKILHFDREQYLLTIEHIQRNITRKGGGVPKCVWNGEGGNSLTCLVLSPPLSVATFLPVINVFFKLYLAYVLRWNRGKNIYFFSHI